MVKTYPFPTVLGRGLMVIDREDAEAAVRMRPAFVREAGPWSTLVEHRPVTVEGFDEVREACGEREERG